MKYMILDPEEGIFLGTTREEPNSMFGAQLTKADRQSGQARIALFSSHNIFDITKAVAFLNEEDAIKYMNTYIKRRCPKAQVVPVYSENLKDKEPYVDVVDIVKSGYGEFAWDLTDAMPMPSQYFH